MDPLKLLHRTDKWYLGGGNRLQWAPSFPQYLDSPGYWDPASYYNSEIGPLFTWTIVNDQGVEIPAKCGKREWSPDALRLKFQCSGDESQIEIIESKCILPNDVALSSLSIKRKPGRKKRRLHLVVWAALANGVEGEPVWLNDVAARKGAVSFTRHSAQPNRPDVVAACSLGIAGKARSFSVLSSEGGSIPPQWSLTPFAEKFRNGTLPNRIQTQGAFTSGMLFIALHIVISSSDQTASIGFASAPTSAEASGSLALVLKQKDPARLSALSWKDHFSSVPMFECSDEHFTRYYWYRWYGLRLNTMYGGEGNYHSPFVCEGIGYFRAPISYSAPCHMLENRWMHEPELARGSIQVFLDNQRDDGGFRGYIDVNYFRQEMFYHANWGNAVTQLDRIHPSEKFLASISRGLERYVRYFDTERDKEGSGLYDIINHYETGQEFMRRYTVVSENADRENWGGVFRLKGIDVTVYTYELKRALARVAERLGDSKQSEQWKSGADKIKEAVLSQCWDPKSEMFFDVDPAKGTRTGVKAATCFYPYFTDIVDERHLNGLNRHLLNPGEFWTKFPVPSTSADDPSFSAEGEWKGKRMNCPWNGRVWPMTNSHVAEAMAVSALRFSNPFFRRKAAEFIGKFIRMMFFEGDQNRPNCFEHYNPMTGHPSRYRGIDDYQHSWVNDLIIKYVCGIRPDDLTVTIDPFPFGLASAKIRNVLIRNRFLDVTIKGKRFHVRIDGSSHAESTIGTPIVLQI